MSFRTRLSLFFLLIVVAPMIAVGALVAELQSRSQLDEADASVATGLNVAESVSRERIAAPQAYAARVAGLTGLEVAVVDGDRTVARAGRIVGDARTGTIRVGPPGSDTRVAVTAPVDPAGVLGSEPLVATILVAFFAVALGLVILLVRRLQGQVAAMLAAARRIGAGDFSSQVPVEGDDEMAGLAREMNVMSGQLSAQMEQLRRQRAELERSIRRIGEAFAHGLDRDAVLGVVAKTALDACAAEHCRVQLSDQGHAAAEAGTALSGADVHEVEQPLVSIREQERRLGTIDIARRDQPFDSHQRELLRYLATQAAASIENLELHRKVARQAVTDELTGLPNHRRFYEQITREVERARRFEHPISLLMFDIDDFKHVNDTYGHLRGDEVLRRIGRVLLEESRGVDEPGRYGGEELVVSLPETSSDGARELAERIRSRVEAIRVPGEDGDGEIGVTVSVGVATLPDVAADAHGLIAAADAALYLSKRDGKNRCTVAGASALPSAAMPQGRAPERRT